ncbi:MAG: peptidase, imelysin family protein [Candidatus Thiodiazotropha sp. (ex Lucina aurantia)]|nr:peptidase, imelysin family protein [Candidatus Thiodiazotropha sp. (ex Lucina pensylvanica)]MBT3024391.1 peptidase, imelysin family protein [Candidatus Thiodiazotropha taylori]MBT3051850.1 peptidase, imelysin family protein [Candidatus Thiodiazotropha sp. (ex Codakia orbicularis)]MBV2104065.1 peptidase, imelysin family protein [Candidatus Thiodiazotropha sp. (ex Lucina aurantia)]MBT3032389.1 peptidase, imelysin family protein [Candidatus Thiodiazotropha sp. (ex Lucina pensylvanica)]
MRLRTIAAAVLSASLITACGGGGGGSDDDDTNTSLINIENLQRVLETNADIALAAYNDSIATAQALKSALAALRADPTETTLQAAKDAWLAAREPYGQTEVYRFRLSPIDSTNYTDEDGPEGDINAWPLGEALIDYVSVDTANTADDFGDDQVGVTTNEAGINDNGALTEADAEADTSNNIIGDASITIDAALLANTATADDEHDVIAGYHAIEFLLWGQDLNDTGTITVPEDRSQAVKTHDASNLASGGQRPLSDFVSAAANDAADRRHQYLEVAVDKLIADLVQVRDGWVEGAAYRTAFTSIADEAEAKQKLAEILTGMGTLSEGELAGERMQIAFSANSQEDEHSCFSDNTHRDIVLNAAGIANSYFGEYAGYDSDLDGFDDTTTNAVSGYGIDDYLDDVGLTTLKSDMESALSATQDANLAIDAAARAGRPVDVLITEAKTTDNPIYTAILALNSQSAVIQQIADELELGTVVDDDASGCNTSDPSSEC